MVPGKHHELLKVAIHSASQFCCMQPAAQDCAFSLPPHSHAKPVVSIPAADDGMAYIDKPASIVL